MELNDLIKIVVSQAVVVVASLSLAYWKLRHDLHLDVKKQIAGHRLERLQQQLSEFYAPLHMLSLTAKELVASTWNTPEWDSAFNDGLLPLHEQMETILINKAHLIDSTIVPESFIHFLRHIRTVRCYKGSGLTATYFARDEQFPNKFNSDIAIAFRLKRAEYMIEFGLVAPPTQSQEGYPD